LYSQTLRGGQGISYSYDNLGRLTSAVYSGLYGIGSSLVGQFYTYQGQNLTQLSDQQKDSLMGYQYTYDSSWRRTSESILGGETTVYAYANGPAAGITWAGSLLQSYAVQPSAGSGGTTQAVSYGYDALGRVSGLQWSWTPNQWFTFEYDPNGQYSRILFPNGQTRAFSYDNQGRLTNLSNQDVNGGILASYAYGYDYDWASGTYSMLGQRTSVNVSATSGTYVETGLTKYQYDARYQLTRVDRPSAGYDTWSYDAIGNRTTSRFLTFTYYKSAQNTLNGQRLRSLSGSPDLLYDSAGNLTGYSGTPTPYTWDFANRLASAAGTAYTYDYLGRRRTASFSGTTTRYISVGLDTVGTRNATFGIADDYVFGPGMNEPLAKRSANGGVSYYGVDGLGSVVLVTDLNGSVVASSTYDPWGIRGGDQSELFGFGGGESSGAFWFFRARYYDPATGRFLSPDPALAYGDTLVYGYAMNDPALNIDPMGLASASHGPAQAHVCCDGKGGFTICWDESPMGSPIENCVEQHERDHMRWFKCHPPYDQLCNGKPKETKYFSMKQADNDAMECDGYQVQYECMKKVMPQLSGAQKQEWFAQMNRLKNKAEKEHKCSTSGW
jgi:RHS repeat-associated protein